MKISYRYLPDLCSQIHGKFPVSSFTCWSAEQNMPRFFPLPRSRPQDGQWCVVSITYRITIRKPKGSHTYNYRHTQTEIYNTQWHKMTQKDTGAQETKTLSRIVYVKAYTWALFNILWICGFFFFLYEESVSAGVKTTRRRLTETNTTHHVPDWNCEPGQERKWKQPISRPGSFLQ